MSKHSYTMLTEETGLSTNDEKVVEMSEFNNPKAFFDSKSKLCGCHQEMQNNRIDVRTCLDARQYCDAVMARYTNLLDCAN